MQELRDAVAEKKERDAAAAAHAAAVGANRENYWAVSGDGDMAAKPAPTPDAGREDGLDEDGYLVVDERKNARCRPRACPAGACTRHPAAIPAHPCDAARLAARSAAAARRRASPPLPMLQVPPLVLAALELRRVGRRRRQRCQQRRA